MTDKTDPIAHAARLLREAAQELQQGHTLSGDRNNWIGEPEAKAAYDDHMGTAAALECWAEAIGAGGVSGPLMGQPQEMPDLTKLTERGAKAWAGVDAQELREGVASAGSEPVARVNDDGFIVEIGDLPIAPGQKLYLHPSPPEGMVGGWRPIETAPKYTEHGVRQHLMLGYAPDEIHEDGFVSQGYWMEAEEDAPDNMGHDGGWVDVHFDFFRCGRSFGAEAYRSAGTQPSHWMPLPEAPNA